MINAKTYNLKGDALKDTVLPEELFGVKVKPTLLAQAVRVYLSNQRSATANAKGRGEVSGSTAKLYRQKGTGRARRGSLRSPVAVGGGVAHGPDGLQNYRLRMPTKMRHLAFLGALSLKAAAGEISIVSGAADATGKTKDMAALQAKLNPKGRVLVVTTGELANFNRAIRNLAKVNVTRSATVSTYDIMYAKEVYLPKEVIDELKKQYVA